MSFDNDVAHILRNISVAVVMVELAIGGLHLRPFFSAEGYKFCVFSSALKGIAHLTILTILVIMC